MRARLHACWLKRLVIFLALVVPALTIIFVPNLSAQRFGRGSRPPQSTIPKPPRPPAFGGPRLPGSGMPNVPGPGNTGSRFGRGGPSSPLGNTGFQHVWSCSKCRAELGRGSSIRDKPNFSSCPHCGVKFINGGFGIGGGQNPPKTPFNNPAGRPGNNPNFPNNPAPGNPPITNPMNNPQDQQPGNVDPNRANNNVGDHQLALNNNPPVDPFVPAENPPSTGEGAKSGETSTSSEDADEEKDKSSSSKVGLLLLVSAFVLAGAAGLVIFLGRKRLPEEPVREARRQRRPRPRRRGDSLFDDD